MTKNIGDRMLNVHGNFATAHSDKIFKNSFQKINYICMKSNAMQTIHLYTKLNSLPSELKSEVSNFVDALLAKTKKKSKKKKPVFGSAKGKIKISEDFDAPLDEFSEYK